MAHGDTRLIPLELQETLLPFRIKSFSLRADSGGAGKFRGGLGFSKEYQILEPCLLQTNLDRTKYPPWGALGGKPAMPGRVVVKHKDSGKVELMCKAKGYPLEPGDVVVLETGGGGGSGPAEDRALDMIQRDLDQGYITPDGAQRDYGVRIDAKGQVSRATA
jgi:N-methylhydantoinase B